MLDVSKLSKHIEHNFKFCIGLVFNALVHSIIIKLKIIYKNI